MGLDSPILKPAPAEHPQLIFDEEYGARIARALGLAEFETRTATFAGAHALVIERYDRAPDAPLGRIHQEDVNQALGARARSSTRRSSSCARSAVRRMSARVYAVTSSPATASSEPGTSR